jgi:hypothetical protein
MRTNVRRIGTAVAVGALLLFSLIPAHRVLAQQGPTLSANATVYATGLNGPRGLRFGTTGLTGRSASDLYVAEAGTGGTLGASATTTYPTAYGQCLPAGPTYFHVMSGYSGRISMINTAGQRTTIVDNLPSGSDPERGTVGPADVEFVNGVLYGLLDSGCTFGNNVVPGGIIQVDNTGSWNLYNLSTWAQQHPPAKPDPSDYAPEGDWYSMTPMNGKMYAVNPNGGQVVEVSLPSGQIREVADLSAVAPDWTGPTGMIAHNGNLYVVTLGPFPAVAGSQEVLQITPDGVVSVYATGLTAATGIAFDSAGNLYALETFTGVGTPGPQAVGTGKVVRVSPGSSAPVTVASGLSFPTAMTFGPDGMLYVSNFGYGPPGSGQIVRIDVNASM